MADRDVSEGLRKGHKCTAFETIVPEAQRSALVLLKVGSCPTPGPLLPPVTFQYEVSGGINLMIAIKRMCLCVCACVWVKNEHVYGRGGHSYFLWGAAGEHVCVCVSV